MPAGSRRQRLTQDRCVREPKEKRKHRAPQGSRRLQRQAPTARTLLKVQRLSSCSPSTGSSTPLSRCRGRNPVSQKRFQQTIKISQSKDSEDNACRFPRSEDSEDHGDSPGQKIQKIMEISQVGGFRRTWRFLSCSTQSRWSMTLLGVQKTAQMPLVQFTEKLVEVTVIMRTSSGTPSTTANSGDASDSDSGNSSEWWTLQGCSRQRHCPWENPKRLSRRHRCSSRR